MTTKRAKGQPPKERKKKSHGIRMYDDDHALAIKEHGSLQKFVDWGVVEMIAKVKHRDALKETEKIINSLNKQ